MRIPDIQINLNISIPHDIRISRIFRIISSASKMLNIDVDCRINSSGRDEFPELTAGLIRPDEMSSQS